jgi:hypothetical protein
MEEFNENVLDEPVDVEAVFEKIEAAPTASSLLLSSYNDDVQTLLQELGPDEGDENYFPNWARDEDSPSTDLINTIAVISNENQENIKTILSLVRDTRFEIDTLREQNAQLMDDMTQMRETIQALLKLTQEKA